MVPVNRADCGLPIFHRPPLIHISRSVITWRAPHVPALTSELLLIFVLIVNQFPINFSHLSWISCPPSISNLMQQGAPSHICLPSRHHASSVLRQARRRLSPSRSLDAYPSAFAMHDAPPSTLPSYWKHYCSQVGSLSTPSRLRWSHCSSHSWSAGEGGTVPSMPTGCIEATDVRRAHGIRPKTADVVDIPNGYISDVVSYQQTRVAHRWWSGLCPNRAA
jgi:hypothetical protein